MGKKHKVITATLGIVAAIAVICAVVFGVLYATARVPDGAAAKANDFYITEDEVASHINQERIANQATDDAAFATWLSARGDSVASYRNDCIDQIATGKLAASRAEETGVSVADSDIDAQIDSYKSSMAFGDDSIWQSTLEQQGMTEEGVREQVRVNLIEQKLYEKEVSHRDASDDETLSYAKATMGGVTLRHSYRLAFTGDRASARAAKAYRALKSAGKMDGDTFAVFAEEYAKDDDSDLAQGDFGWSDSNDLPDGYAEILGKLSAGEFSEPTSVEGDDAVEIVFCDVLYSFPGKKNIGKLEFKDMPRAVREHVAEKASDQIYTRDCSNYLAWLRARASVTYYPVPQDAAYNVDMSKAGSQTSSDSAAASSSSAP